MKRLSLFCITMLCALFLCMPVFAEDPGPLPDPVMQLVLEHDLDPPRVLIPDNITAWEKLMAQGAVWDEATVLWNAGDDNELVKCAQEARAGEATVCIGVVQLQRLCRLAAGHVDRSIVCSAPGEAFALSPD